MLGTWGNFTGRCGVLALAEGGALLAGCQSGITTDYIRAQKIVSTQILMGLVCLDDFET